MIFPRRRTYLFHNKEQCDKDSAISSSSVPYLCLLHTVFESSPSIPPSIDRKIISTRKPGFLDIPPYIFTAACRGSAFQRTYAQHNYKINKFHLKYPTRHGIRFRSPILYVNGGGGWWLALF